jgi:hypothetical protein
MLISPMDTPVEIRYAGVVVARANEVRRMTVGGVDMFLAMPDPLPAGTLVGLGNDTQARVEKVIESSDPSVSGIYVKVVSDEEAARPWLPCFREDEVPAPRPPAVVVSPVIVRPVHTPPAPRPAPPPRVPTPVQVRAVVPAPEPVVETPLPEVVASVVPEAPPAPFVAPLPKPDEQVAHFDSPPPPPPPAVVENAMKNDRRRSTIVVAVPPPAEGQRPPGAVAAAAGEIDTGSRKVRQAAQEVRSASIVVDEEHQQEPPAAATPPAAAAEPPAEPAPQQELRLEDLAPARALPSARARATKRRKTTSR